MEILKFFGQRRRLIRRQVSGEEPVRNNKQVQPQPQGDPSHQFRHDEILLLIRRRFIPRFTRRSNSHSLAANRANIKTKRPMKPNTIKSIASSSKCIAASPTIIVALLMVNGS